MFIPVLPLAEQRVFVMLWHLKATFRSREAGR